VGRPNGSSEHRIRAQEPVIGCVINRERNLTNGVQMETSHPRPQPSASTPRQIWDGPK
jgi:hypothetical protein